VTDQTKAVLNDPMIAIGKVAHALGTTTSTRYRHIIGERSSIKNRGVE